MASASQNLPEPNIEMSKMSESLNSQPLNSEKPQKNETTYSEYFLKQKIAKVLDLPLDDSWEIISQNDSLAMIHHTPNADINIYANLRGVVVDIVTGKVVSYSYPHAQTFICNSLSSDLPDDSTKLCFNNMTLDLNTTKITHGYEGPLYHIFLHNGVVYHSTRKRLDGEKSRWGNSPSFREIYNKLGGPADSVLFDKTKLYSPYCYTFILNSPEVAVVSRTVNKGKLIYLGCRKMYSLDNSPYALSDIDATPVDLTQLHNLTVPEKLTVTAANLYLQKGFYADSADSVLDSVLQSVDSRLTQGEFIILQDAEGFMFRIESESYHWRSLIRNNNPNYLHRFFEIYDISLKNSEEYTALFPDLTKCFSDFKYMCNFPDVISDRDLKLYNAWICFILAMPIHMEMETIGYMDYLLENKKKCAQWIIGLSDSMISNTLDFSKYSKRLADILTKTNQFAENYIKKGAVDLKTGKPKNVHTVRHENCRNFINKEQGTSLYRLIREMNSHSH